MANVVAHPATPKAKGFKYSGVITSEIAKQYKKNDYVFCIRQLNGTDISGLTAEEAQRIVESGADGYDLSLMPFYDLKDDIEKLIHAKANLLVKTGKGKTATTPLETLESKYTELKPTLSSEEKADETKATNQVIADEGGTAKKDKTAINTATTKLESEQEEELGELAITRKILKKLQKVNIPIGVTVWLDISKLDKKDSSALNAAVTKIEGFLYSAGYTVGRLDNNPAIQSASGLGLGALYNPMDNAEKQGAAPSTIIIGDNDGDSKIYWVAAEKVRREADF